ncbi:hypothetical protein [Enterococcus sp. AZ128]|uniref:hypothetical protein n=1 Tax=unclassified Enterococcus TaxID=2608891 RepID=UPI003F686A87
MLDVELVSVCEWITGFSVELEVLFEIAGSGSEEDKLTLFVELVDMSGSEKAGVADSLLVVVVSAVPWSGRVNTDPNIKELATNICNLFFIIIIPL